MSNPKIYQSERPCPKCGGVLRYVIGKACVSCARVASNQWQKDNPDRYKALLAVHTTGSEPLPRKVGSGRKRGVAPRKPYSSDAPEVRARYSWKSKGMVNLPTREPPAVCEICGNPESQGHRLSADHCHVSGLFRGWLCKKCNRLLGQLGDERTAFETTVARIRDYLVKNSQIDWLNII